MYSNGLPTLVHTLVTLRGRPVVGALVLLNVVPTNNTSANVADSISMVDDGRADPDLVAGDGIYSAYVFDHVGQIKLEVEVREGLYPVIKIHLRFYFHFHFPSQILNCIHIIPILPHPINKINIQYHCSR